MGLAMMPANAGSSRLVGFTLPCDGLTKFITINATGFPASSAQFVLGGAVDLYDIKGALQYIIFTGPGSDKQTILVLGINANGGRFAMPTFYPTPSDAAGNIALSIIGSCVGSGPILGFATVYFN